MATKTHIYNDMRTEGNITKRQIEPYELLANAVIELAVQDYRMLRSGRIPTVSEETRYQIFQIKMVCRFNELISKRTVGTAEQ